VSEAQRHNLKKKIIPTGKGGAEEEENEMEKAEKKDL